jgi:hypothetical protein
MNIEASWTVYRTRFLVHARQLTEPLAFTDALGREHSGLPGDYLVESPLGFRRITPRAIFEDVYVPIAPVQPQSSPAKQTSLERALHVLDQCMARRPRPTERRGSSPRSNHHYTSFRDRPVPNWNG